MAEWTPPPIEKEKEPEDLGNPEHVQERNREVRLAGQKEGADLRTLLGSTQGRRWMWKFIGSLGPFRTPFGDSPHMSYFAGGRQNVALELIAEINRVAPDLYSLMQKENPDG